MKTRDSHKWTDKQVGPYLDRDKLGELYEKCRKIAVDMFGEDCDGAVPVDIDLVDRTRYQRLYYRAIPYDDHVEGPQEQAELIQALLTNLKISSDAVDRFFRCLEFMDFSWMDAVRASKEHPPVIHTASDATLSAENRQLSTQIEEVEAQLKELRSKRAHELRTNNTIKLARAQREHAHDALREVIKIAEDAPGKTGKTNAIIKAANTGFKIPKKKKDS